MPVSVGTISPALLSVPSSSGKGLQRPRCRWHRHRWYCFQSPLHRGRVFNAGSMLTSSTKLLLSVPSSSGKGLQPSKPTLYEPPPPNFQSPLHRGRVFNCPIGRHLLPAGDAFSPLFIGEGSSTTCDIMCHCIDIATFSPLFIGEGSSTAVAHLQRDAGLGLSVPSSSGKGLQPLAAPERIRSVILFQSPLHRGRVFNDDLLSAPSRPCILSVPSSSGKGLQQM